LFSQSVGGQFTPKWFGKQAQQREKPISHLKKAFGCREDKKIDQNIPIL